MDNVMKLSYKDTKFIIDAINNLLAVYATRIESEDIDEDETSDLGNDSIFLDSLRSNLAIKLQSPQVEDTVTSSSISNK
jgi:hypothetical protein